MVRVGGGGVVGWMMVVAGGNHPVQTNEERDVRVHQGERRRKTRKRGDFITGYERPVSHTGSPQDAKKMQYREDEEELVSE